MAYIDPFDLLLNLELDLEDGMGSDHPSRKLINAIRESIVPTSNEDTKQLE